MTHAHRRATCEEAFRKLDDFLDRRLDVRGRQLVEEHLAICDGCAAEFGFEASVLENVRRKMREGSAPPDLLDRIRTLIARAGPGNSAEPPAMG